MNKNTIGGTAKKIEGSAESIYGTVTGDHEAEATGDAKRVEGAARNAFGKAEDAVRDTYDSVASEINARPVRSALIALGAGFVLGKLLGL